MPELPEVQSVVNHFKGYLEGQTIKMIKPLNGYHKVFHSISSKELNQKVKHQTIYSLWRRGKYIIMDLDRGHLSIHLRMTGKLQTKINETDQPKHFTAFMQLENGKYLYFKDYRKFGRWYFFNNLSNLETKLGCEPLSSNFTTNFLKNGLKQSRGIIKPKLLAQSFIAGLGNIYIDESLWFAGIHPKTKCCNISSIKIKRLHSAIKKILKKAIQYNGTTIINYSPGDDTKGNFSESLKVFRKQNELCPRCMTSISKIFVGQRGTHFCPSCQRL